VNSPSIFNDPLLLTVILVDIFFILEFKGIDFLL
jgi:hypothetical protein